MPKTQTDYSATIIYKLCCKDPEIDDIYIGHTTNFIQRKNKHKTASGNINYNSYVYMFIRDHGGWDNWSMIMIEEINCENVLDARRQERKFIEEYQATLNIQIPSRPQKEYQEINKDKIKEQRKEFRELNKDKLSEQKKEYYETNKDKIKEQTKEYYETNKDKILDKVKEYREANIEKIKEYDKQRQYQEMFCECCKKNINKREKTKHYKTKLHIKNMEQQI